MGLFQNIPDTPEDAILGLTQAFNEDLRENRVNLSVGIYRDENLKSVRMKAVHDVETILVDLEPSKVYLPIEGNLRYLRSMASLIFSEEFIREHGDRLVKVQTLGGTGALRVGAELLYQEISQTVHLSTPTWPNHIGIFKRTQFELNFYPYYSEEMHAVDFEKFCDYLNELHPNEVVILQACCHNPTGFDFTGSQWEELAKIFKNKQLIPFFDLAYQGFGENVKEDVHSIRTFAKEGLEFFVACSNSKNFGLYGERIGALYILTQSSEETDRLLRFVKTLVRTNYSNPPRHGAGIVEHILQTEQLIHEWEEELKAYRIRLSNTKKDFVEALHKVSKQDFGYLLNSRGMFAFTGLSKEQVLKLREEHAIYMTLDGRINISGLNQHNLDYVVNCIAKVQ